MRFKNAYFLGVGLGIDRFYECTLVRQIITHPLVLSASFLGQPLYFARHWARERFSFWHGPLYAAGS